MISGYNYNQAIDHNFGNKDGLDSAGLCHAIIGILEMKFIKLYSHINNISIVVAFT